MLRAARRHTLTREGLLLVLAADISGHVSQQHGPTPRRRTDLTPPAGNPSYFKRSTLSQKAHRHTNFGVEDSALCPLISPRAMSCFLV